MKKLQNIIKNLQKKNNYLLSLILFSVNENQQSYIEWLKIHKYEILVGSIILISIPIGLYVYYKYFREINEVLLNEELMNHPQIEFLQNNLNASKTLVESLSEIRNLFLENKMLYILEALPYSEFMWELKKYEEKLDILAIYYKNDESIILLLQIIQNFNN